MPEPDGPPGDLLADPAEAEDAERLAGELDPAPARALPGSLLQRGVRLRDVARERDQQADRLLGRRDDRRVGRVRDDDPAAGGGIHVDVVDADAGPADHLQPVGARDQVRGQLASPSGSRSRRSRRSSRRDRSRRRRRRRSGCGGARRPPRRSARGRGPAGGQAFTRRGTAANASSARATAGAALDVRAGLHSASSTAASAATMSKTS